jgi:hypothetical protein
LNSVPETWAALTTPAGLGAALATCGGPNHKNPLPTSTAQTATRATDLFITITSL